MAETALGLVRVATAKEVVEERERNELVGFPDLLPAKDKLAALIEDNYQKAKEYRDSEGITARLEYASQTRIGEYDEQKLAQIRAVGGSEDYARITANKCRVVAAWLTDVYIGQTEKPWVIRPSADPTLPGDLQASIDETLRMQVQQFMAQVGEPPSPELIVQTKMELERDAKEKARELARRAAEEVNKIMQSQLEEGGFYDAITDFIDDFVTYPTAILKGPVFRLRDKLVWNGNNPEVSEDVVYEFTRVDPRLIYPAPGIATPQDGYIIEVVRFGYEDLYELIGQDGYNEEAIRTTLRKARRGQLDNWLDLDVPGSDDYEDAPEKAHNDMAGMLIDCLEYYGPVFGDLLKQWNIGEDIDEDAVYDIVAWVIDGEVIKVNLNPDPLGRRPYHIASYENVPGSFWGRGLPDILRDVQGVANASIRALVNNMSLASGPQVVIDIDRLAEGEELTNLTPWRIWQVSSGYNAQSASPVMQFFQPNSNAAELLNVLNSMYQLADEFSLIPRYMAGQQPAGTVGRTASGLSMLLNAANKGLKRVVAELDVRVLEPLLRQLYTYDMMYEDLPEYAADIEIVARGAIGVMQEDTLQVRRNEFLQITANPLDSQIIGVEGRAAVLREVAKGLGMDVNDIVPDLQKIKELEQMQQLQQMQGGAPDVMQDYAGNQLGNGAPATQLLPNK